MGGVIDVVAALAAHHGGKKQIERSEYVTGNNRWNKEESEFGSRIEEDANEHNSTHGPGSPQTFIPAVVTVVDEGRYQAKEKS